MSKAQKLLENQIVQLDFGTFQHTEFRNCKLVYAGGRPPLMVNNSFVDCEWVFVSEAQNTVSFLKMLASSGGGFEALVKRTLFGAGDG
jgi:hypothetical protein